jgi:hypothetical protein
LGRETCGKAEEINRPNSSNVTSFLIQLDQFLRRMYHV